MTEYLTQHETMTRAHEFFDRFGLMKSWVAKQAKIHPSDFSCFLNEKSVLSKKQLKRLVYLMDEYERRMEGFNVREENMK